MIYPSINSLLTKVDCNYTLVVETAKRARQILDHAPVLTNYPSTKPVTLAIHEIYEGKVRCKPL